MKAFPHLSRIARLSTAGFVLALFCAAGCAAILSASQHYQAHLDGQSLFAVLREDIRNGDTRETVQERLGLRTYDNETHRRGTHTAAQMNPGDFPDGLRETDAIVFYPYDDRGLVTLIFRDGKLINHNPAKYPALKAERSVKY